METINRIVITCSVMLALVCCTKPNNDTTYSVKGAVVSAPSNLPLSGVLVRIMNDSYTLASTETSNDGTFSISVEKDKIDASYYLSLYDAEMAIKKDVSLTGFGLSELDMGNIILYDSRNPYDLPIFTYGGYTYVVHPVAREKMSFSEATKYCEELRDYGIREWIMPDSDALMDYVSKNCLSSELPTGSYWSSSFEKDGYHTSVNFNNSGLVEIFTCPAEDSGRRYVIPFHQM